MPIAYLDISPQLLTQYLSVFREGRVRRSFIVTQNGLPSDTTVSDVEVINCGKGCFIRLTLFSLHFKEDQPMLPSPMVSVWEANL